MTQHWVPVAPPDACPERVEIEGIPLILVRCGSGWAAYLDDCPDETLPLEPKVTPSGGIVCSQHGASFSVATGCLLRIGNAHHADRCAAGLFKVDVRSSEGAALELLVSRQLRERWAEVQRRRFRKSFGRGPLGSVRYLAALLAGASKRNGRSL